MLDLLKPVRNLSISKRMLGLIGIFVIVLLGLLAVNIEASSSAQEASARAQLYAQYQVKAKEIESAGLRMRQAEKDFLLTKNIKLRQQYAQSYVDVVERAGEIYEGIGGKAGKVSSDLRKILGRHSDQFDAVTSLMNDIGLSADKGLEGQLRSAVHEIEFILKQYDDKDLTIIMLQMRRHEKDFIARLDPKYIDRIGQRREEFLARLSSVSYGDTAVSRIKNLLETYVASFMDYSSKRMMLIDEVAKLQSIYQESAPLYADLVTATGQAFIAANADLDNARKSAATKTFIISGFAIFVVIGLGLIIITTTVSPITGLESALAKISSGDYSAMVPGTEFKDELGSVARTVTALRDSAAEREELEEMARKAQLERMEQEKIASEQKAEAERLELEVRAERVKEREERSKHLQNLIAEFDAKVSKLLVRLSSASYDMNENAAGMFQIAQTTGSNVEQVTDAATTVRESITANAAAVGQFTGSIREVNSQVRSANDLCLKAVDLASQGEQSIQDMSKRAEQVNGVISMITDIAKQTNLLALNATIEAARAGELGRGFAIVASEVKSLSNQTAEATEQVTREVLGMQDTVHSTVDRIQNIRTVIGDLSQNMNGIATASEEQEVTTQEIARSTDQSASGAEKVSTEIDVVSRNATRAREISSSLKSAANDLTDLGESMSAEITHFLKAVRV